MDLVAERGETGVKDQMYLSQIRGTCVRHQLNDVTCVKDLTEDPVSETSKAWANYQSSLC